MVWWSVGRPAVRVTLAKKGSQVVDAIVEIQLPILSRVGRPPLLLVSRAMAPPFRSAMIEHESPPVVGDDGVLARPGADLDLDVIVMTDQGLQAAHAPAVFDHRQGGVAVGF